MRVVLAGGSGSLGRRVAEDLGASGHDLVILTRRAAVLMHQIRSLERDLGANLLERAAQPPS